nr:hypothetical protein [Saprospiraceae bacterium]
MKKTLLFFGFTFLGVLFFACDKDQVPLEEDYLDSTEIVSSERSSCGDDAGYCQEYCIISNLCCCTIEWVYEGLTQPSQYQSLPFPSFCVAMDILPSEADCFIPIPCESVTWNSLREPLCPPFYPWSPYPPRLTYKCVPAGTAMSISNPHTSLILEIILTCYSGSGSPISEPYDIGAGETKEINFRGCKHQVACE